MSCIYGTAFSGYFIVFFFMSQYNDVGVRRCSAPRYL